MGTLLAPAPQPAPPRVAPLMVGPARGPTATNWEGILEKPYSHHAMTHSIARHVEQLLKLDQFHVLALRGGRERREKIEEDKGK